MFTNLKSNTNLHTPGNNTTKANIVKRQKPLRELYKTKPEHAWIIDTAKTSSKVIPADDPLHTHIQFETEHEKKLKVGVHKAVGGDGDCPSPGEILSAAIASCLDSTIRMIANIKNIPIKTLKVVARSNVDVRGTLMMDREVPVGFQHIDINVDIKTDETISASHVEALLKAAERSCIIIQTLRNTPQINIENN